MKAENIKWHGLDAVILESNVYEAVLIPGIGANLVRLYNKEKEVDILRTPKYDEIENFKSRPQVYGLPLLFPPNRIEDGTYIFNEKRYMFPITIPAQKNYHHGIIKSQVFTITQSEINDDFVEVVATFISDENNNQIFVDFPHAFECNMIYRLSNEGLTHTVIFKNNSKEPMPLGVGYHTPLRIPFHKRSDRTNYRLLLSVGKRWEIGDRGLPTGKLLNLTPDQKPLRTEGIRPTGTAIEWALTNESMIVDEQEYNGAVLIDLKAKLRVFYEVDNQFKHWTYWNNDGEQEWACPEPQTWAINAPNLKLPAEVTGFQALEPGELWSATSKFYVRPLI